MLESQIDVVEDPLRVSNLEEIDVGALVKVQLSNETSTDLTRFVSETPDPRIEISERCLDIESILRFCNRSHANGPSRAERSEDALDTIVAVGERRPGKLKVIIRKRW